MGYNPTRSYFPSQNGLYISLGLCVACFVITCGVTLSLWLSMGCTSWLPFISDLGLHGRQKTVFTVGMALTSLAMSCCIPHFHTARQDLLERAQSEPMWHWIHRLTSLSAVTAALGLGPLGFFPWSEHLWPHLVCAGAVFSGGFWWCVGSFLLAHHLLDASTGLERALEYEDWNACRRLRRCQGFVVVALVMILCQGFLLDCIFLWNHREFISAAKLKTMLNLAEHHFVDYCTAKRGWHQYSSVDLIALSEWVYVAVLVAGVVAASADVGTHLAAERRRAHQERLLC